METQKTPQFKILRSGMSMAFIELCNDKNKETLDFVLEKRYKASELQVSRRVLSHWRGLGLIDLYGDDPQPTRLSFLEIFWLQTAIELRTFGLSLEKITAVKDYFFKDQKDFPIFESYLVRSVFDEEKDFFLLVSSDGRADIGTREEVDTSDTLGLLEMNYIKINFNVIKNGFVTFKLDTVNQKSTGKFLSTQEIGMIDLIRSGDYQEIKFSFQNGVVSHISKKSLQKNPDPFKEIRKIIASDEDFCEISLKRQNGKFVVMGKTITQKT